MKCWLAETLGLDDCDFSPRWEPDKAHIGFTENWLSKAATGPRLTKEQANDDRLIRPACRKHHRQLDVTKTIRLTRKQIPRSVEDYALEHHIGYMLNRTYGRQD